MAVQTETNELIARYIEPDSGLATPDRAWIVDAAYHVKTIIRNLRQSEWDVEATARHYEIPVNAVRAAVAFYERHRDVIDARILLDDSPFYDWEAIDNELVGPEDAWIWSHIMFLDGMRTPHDARMEATGTRVKAIIRQLQLEGGDIASVARIYGLSSEAMRAALVYYNRHRDLFGAKILLDNAPELS